MAVKRVVVLEDALDESDHLDGQQIRDVLLRHIQQDLDKRNLVLLLQLMQEDERVILRVPIALPLKPLEDLILPLLDLIEALRQELEPCEEPSAGDRVDLVIDGVLDVAFVLEDVLRLDDDWDRAECVHPKEVVLGDHVLGHGLSHDVDRGLLLPELLI